MSVVRKTPQERFWSKVQVAPGCWPWIAALDNHGYGRIGRGGKNGGMLKAHRLSWEMHFGRIPDGMKICHSCDNPRCVNPGHLFIGTQKDNILDAIAKKRHKLPTGITTEKG